MSAKFTDAQIRFAQLLREEASASLANWCLRQFDAGHDLGTVKDAIRRAMAIVEGER